MSLYAIHVPFQVLSPRMNELITLCHVKKIHTASIANFTKYMSN